MIEPTLTLRDRRLADFQLNAMDDRSRKSRWRSSSPRFYGAYRTSYRAA